VSLTIVPLQARRTGGQDQARRRFLDLKERGRAIVRGKRYTKLLLDHLQDLLLVEFLRQALHRRQGLATITLYHNMSVLMRGLGRAFRTLNPDVDVILRLIGLPCLLVGVGEGV